MDSVKVAKREKILRSLDGMRKRIVNSNEMGAIDSAARAYFNVLEYGHSSSVLGYTEVKALNWELAKAVACYMEKNQGD